jgi:hypothetical protein
MRVAAQSRAALLRALGVKSRCNCSGIGHNGVSPNCPVHADGVALPGPVVTDIPNEAWGAPYSTSATNDARAIGVLASRGKTFSGETPMEVKDPK